LTNLKISKTKLIGFGAAFAVIVMIKTIFDYLQMIEQRDEYLYRQAQTLASYMQTHRDYYQKLYFDDTLHLNEKTLSGLPAYSALPISEKFASKNILKMKLQTVSDRSRNQKNKADDREMEAIRYFRTNPDAGEYFKTGNSTYQYALPLTIKTQCLKCHGAHSEAPPFIRERYKDAYDYKLGELRGIISIQIPINQIDAYFMNRFLVALVYDFFLLIALFVLIQWLIRYFQHLHLRMEETIARRTSEITYANALLRSYKLALDESNIVSKSNKNGIITYVNDNFVKITGYSFDEAIGRSHNILRHPATSPEIFADMWKTIRSKKVWKGTMSNLSKSGETYWIDTTVLPILDENNEILEYIAVRHDVTELIQQRELLETIAYTNTLTKLPNRERLIEKIKLGKCKVLALLDFDKFSQINDVYGAEIGDQLLIRLSALIHSVISERGNYHLFHLHADEFAVISDTFMHGEFYTDMKQLAEIVNRWKVRIDPYDILISMTVGVTFAHDDLMSTADIALKTAKQTNKDIVLYDESLSLGRQYTVNLEWISRINSALLEDRFTVVFQKIIDNASGSGMKYEALVRMADEEGKLVSPYFFLDISKQSRQYDAIMRVVVDKTLRRFQTIDAEVSINLTIEDILNDTFKHYLLEKIVKSGIGERIIFEIVESEGIRNFDEIIDFIHKVKALGCRIAIDDFGSGYSNFEYLVQLEADFIKIDGSIIKKIISDTNAHAVIKAIVLFARETGMKTIAEFVENEAIFEKVKAMGIDYSQGYYFSVPSESIITGEVV